MYFCLFEEKNLSIEELPKMPGHCPLNDDYYFDIHAGCVDSLTCTIETLLLYRAQV